MTPRQIRKSLESGSLTVREGALRHPPEPPREMTPFKRLRMRPAIRAAVLFLRGRRWQEILKSLIDEGHTVKHDMSKSRVQQYIEKGIQFLEGRGCFETTRPKREACDPSRKTSRK